MGFIRKFLLPSDVDFNAALLAQAQTSRLMIDKMYQACIDNDRNALAAIPELAQHAREQKTRNMAQLLNVFITPYDKESIYRMITQLDWIALSVKHFQLETEIYNTHSLNAYKAILEVITEMAVALEGGMTQLSIKNINTIASSTEQIHDQYDKVVEACARATAKLLAHDDCKHIIRHKDILLQLKEIARRIHITANTLEDMAIKIV